MSFLYKALLKEDAANAQASAQADGQANAQSQPQAQAGAYSGTPNYYVPQDNIQHKDGTSWIAWLAIAMLLLIVGLLGGYILGNQADFFNEKQPISSPIEQPGIHSSSTNAVVANSKSPNYPLTNTTASNTAIEENVATQDVASINSSAAGERAADNEQPTEVNIDVAMQAEQAVDDEPQLVINVADLVASESSMDDVPEDLQNKFAKVVADMEREQNDEQTSSRNQQDKIIVETSSTLTDIKELEAVDKALVPAISYEMHIYSSEPSERWIRINNQTLYEGDSYTDYLKLAEIRQDVIVWETPYKRFSQTALEDYK